MKVEKRLWNIEASVINKKIAQSPYSYFAFNRTQTLSLNLEGPKNVNLSVKTKTVTLQELADFSNLTFNMLLTYCIFMIGTI